MSKSSVLPLGDIFSLSVFIFIGFSAHGEGDLSFLPRMAAAFFPLLVGWFLLAPWFGLFQPQITSNPKLLWRPALAMLFAAPFAALLRGFLLGEDIQPVFVLVFGLTNALGMTAWRWIWTRIGKRIS
ncbi:MAG: DUF3054 domain-containing protein [Chloroflexota bacterium]